MADMKFLGLIIKTTRRCNLRCSYCHDWRSHGDSMPFDVLATLTAKALASPDRHRIHFIWHGGEPLLLGRDFYLKALCLQQEFRQEGQMINNVLQTNGTLVDEAWCKFFAKHRFQIGVSVDGLERVHNLNRAYPSGRGSFGEAIQAISLLQRHNVRFGVLTVLNHRTLKLSPAAIFNFFVDLGVKSFAFLPVRPNNIIGTTGTPNGDYLTPDEYMTFMRAIFDLWYDLDDPSIRIRDFDSILGGLFGGSACVCWLAGDCLGRYYSIETNGDVYHCDKFLGDPRYHVGNIMAADFHQIRQSERFRELAAQEAIRLAVCQRCDWFEVCRGGCPHDDYIAGKYGVDLQEAECSLRRLIEYICERVSKDLVRENDSNT